MATATHIGTTIKARIDTLSIWGHCRFPCQHFPFGFEFAYVSLKANKLEADQDNPEEMLYNPDSETPCVLVRVDEPERLTPEMKRHYDSYDNELKVSFEHCPDWLGVSHWKLIDILEEQHEDELTDAMQVQILARNYEIVTFSMENGKIKEMRTRP